MLKHTRRILFTFSLIVGYAGTWLFAQVPDSIVIPATQPTTQPATTQATSNQAPKSNGLDSIPSSQPIASDTSKISRIPPVKKKKKIVSTIASNEVYYFYPEAPKQIHQFVDTIVNTPFIQYDPARKGKYDYATLGAIGGPMLPLHYKWEDKFGSRTGIDVFAPYIRDESEVRFYTKSKAFSDFYYSQGTEQNDHVFHGDFGRSFDNGIKVSVSHDRLIHSLNNADLPLNSNALFPFPSSKNTSLITGLAYQKPNSKYQAFFTYAHNEINQLYNGGISSTNASIPISVIDDVIRNADTLEVGISIPQTISGQSAKLRYRMRSAALTQYLTLAGGKDSTTVSSRIFNLNHKIKYTNDIYRFSDATVDSAYYKNLITDVRGLRVVLLQKLLDNYIGLNTLKTYKGEVVPSILGDIRLGLRHQLARFDGEGYNKVINNLFAEGAWKVNPFPQLTLDIFGQVGLLDNIGDFRISASANLNMNKWGSLQGILRQQLYSPSIYAQQNFITKTQVWNTDFNKSFHSELGFKYLLPKFQLEAGVSYFLLDNHVYYTDQFAPTQKDGAINLLQIYLRKDISWKILHLENMVMLQSSTDDDIIRLPNWWSRHSLFVQRKIFNKIMLARLGLDLRLNAPYFANNFNPALGQFYVQDEREIQLYPALDVHFGFVVQTFRIFLKMENISTLLTDDTFYQVPYYPQKELSFRFGLSWRFLDQNSNKRASRDSGNQQQSRNPNSGSDSGRPRF